MYVLGLLPNLNVLNLILNICVGTKPLLWIPATQLAELASLSGKCAPSGTSGAAFSPHESISPEIWAEIFLVVIDGLPIRFPPDFSRPHWVLSRTCSHWRTIAFNDSRLWNSIEVISISMFSSAKIVAFANRMIFLSIPLSISVREDFSGDVPSFSAEVVGALVIPHLPRTRALKLFVKADGYLRFFQHHLNRSSPSKFWTLNLITALLINPSSMASEPP